MLRLLRKFSPLFDHGLNSDSEKERAHWRRSFWLIGLLMLLFAGVGTLASGAFSYDVRVRDMPLIELVLFLFVAGVLFLPLALVIRRARFHPMAVAVIAGIFLIGLTARLLLMFSEPVLEDDYQRYLWDGGVVAAGLDPYTTSPADVLAGRAPILMRRLADEAYPIVERINHPELRTIYPPGAEAAFAAAHLISPWSLMAWRGILLLSEVVSFFLILQLLLQFGRAAPFAALYWWNPLVMKEVMNSAHMEGVLVPLLLTGVLMAVRQRFALSSLLLSLAAAMKFWPALLLPLIWRRMMGRPLLLSGSVLLSLLIGGLILAPYLLSGLDESAGLVAYAERWKTNALIFPLFEAIVSGVAGLFGAASIAPFLARGLVGLFLIAVVLWLAAKKSGGQKETFFHIFTVIVLIFLLSPAQFPWYLLWVAPFLPLYPLTGLMLLVPLMSLYYLGFYLMVHDLVEPWRQVVTGVVWLPVLLVLMLSCRRLKELPFLRGTRARG